MKQVYIGSDHGGFRLKDKLIEELRQDDWIVTDLSTKYNPDDDYPDIAFSLGEKVILEKAMGILICRSGVGVCIAANKVKGVRAAMAINLKQTRKSREDDDANIICLSADYLSDEENIEIVKEFLNSVFFSEERFIRRIKKIKKYETT